MMSYFSVANNIPSPHLNVPRAKCSQPHQSSKWGAVFLIQICTTTCNPFAVYCRWNSEKKVTGMQFVCLCLCWQYTYSLLPLVKTYCSVQRFTCAVFLKHPTLQLLYSTPDSLMSLGWLWVRAVMCYWSWCTNTQVLSKFTETMHQWTEWKIVL